MSRRRQNAGYTLLEVVVGLLLVAAAMTAVSRTVAMVARQQRLSEQRAIALEQAANLLERAQAISWGELDEIVEWQLPADGPRIGAKQRASLALREGEPMFIGQQQIEKKRIGVQVEWQDAHGVPHQVQLFGWRYRIAEERDS